MRLCWASAGELKLAVRIAARISDEEKKKGMREDALAQELFFMVLSERMINSAEF
ncbi:MAG TPA: hypothetical protein VGR47_07395 [Terracidiphilus sp.]|nr:hypothetical protein [Terracidiphilus sp.]